MSVTTAETYFRLRDHVLWRFESHYRGGTLFIYVPGRGNLILGNRAVHEVLRSLERGHCTIDRLVAELSTKYRHLETVVLRGRITETVRVLVTAGVLEEVRGGVQDC